MEETATYITKDGDLVMGGVPVNLKKFKELLVYDNGVKVRKKDGFFVAVKTANKQDAILLANEIMKLRKLNRKNMNINI